MHNSKGKKWYNNGKIDKRFFPNTQPEGWYLGRLAKTNKSLLNTISREEIDKIIELYLKPMNLSQVSKETKISIYYIIKILNDNNIPMHSKEIINKLMVETGRETKMYKYGNPNYVNTEKRVVTLKNETEDYWIARKDKVKKTCFNRYGVTNVFKTDFVKDKSKKTKLELYGSENFNNREKYIQTNINRYGVENYSQSSQFIDRPLFNRFKVDSIYLDSFPELCVYLYCIKNNIKIERNAKRFQYSYENKKHYCFVDFKINDELIEIKGDYLYSKMLIPGSIDNVKLKCLLDNKVQIWTSNKYNFYIE